MYLKAPVIFDHIERIIALSKEFYPEEKLFTEGEESFKALEALLHISPVQALFFSHILAEKKGGPVSPSDIGEELNCSRLRLLRHSADFDALREKKLIRSFAGKRRLSPRGADMEYTAYYVPQDVIKALETETEYQPASYRGISTEKLFEIAEDLFRERDGRNLGQYELAFELKTLISQNLLRHFALECNKLKLNSVDLILFMYFCHEAVNRGNTGPVYLREIEDLYDSRTDYHEVKRTLLNGEHPLISKKIIVPFCDKGLGRREAFELTGKTKKEMLGEFNLSGRKIKNREGLKFYKSITAKELFYNPSEGEQIERLTELLQKENFQKVCKRLKEGGMSTGFACLFSGAPGTGKTETVYQIARKTRRNILEVDIADTKSMWFGESEKKIKEIFDRYREFIKECRKSKALTPILFFNEADGVLGRRSELGSAGRSVDRTMNSMQNILLEEFENLKGILIAATNLRVNLDPAFDRRFLYKITFAKPDVKSREAIWKTKFPALPVHNAAALASRFDLSGGQIENVARKYTVELAVSGAEPSVEKIQLFCEEENSPGEGNSVIGFRG